MQKVNSGLKKQKTKTESFPHSSVGKASRPGFNCWVAKIPWRSGVATHSSILAWIMSWAEKPGGPQFMGLQKPDTTERYPSSFFLTLDKRVRERRGDTTHRADPEARQRSDGKGLDHYPSQGPGALRRSHIHRPRCSLRETLGASPTLRSRHVCQGVGSPGAAGQVRAENQRAQLDPASGPVRAPRILASRVPPPNPMPQRAFRPSFRRSVRNHRP